MTHYLPPKHATPSYRFCVYLAGALIALDAALLAALWIVGG